MSEFIDDVDVSYCEYSRYDEDEKIYTCDLSEFDNKYKCCENPNCYFKQLERKKDQCSECDVAERMSKMIWLVTNGMMSYSNYTYEAMSEVYQEQIEKLANKIAKNKLDDVRNILKSELDFVKDYNGEIICLQVRISKLKELEEILNEMDS